MRSKIDERSKGNACFIDIRKAFDTLEHKILLLKLDKYGFRGPIYNLMANYMSDRWQYAIHDETKSTMKIDCHWCLKRINFGTLLVSSYINDLPSTCKNSKRSLFADDTSVCNIKKTRKTKSPTISNE